MNNPTLIFFDWSNMFIIVKIKDKIRIDPNCFEKNFINAIKDEIHIKYSKKVLLNIGLCISIYDFVDIGDPFIIPGDGATYSEVIFRMIVFKPFLGESIIGTIISSDKTKGLNVHLDFFRDIIIPPHLFQENTVL